MSKQILVVDDSESIREVLVFALENAGYQVVTAIDGMDALNFLDGRHIDLVLTDYHMPHMTGLQLIGEIRKMDSYKFMPILILTTENQIDLMREAKNSGATGWLMKPFNTEKLIQTLRKVIR